MTWSFSIGRFLGSDLRVHGTFFLLLAWIGFTAFANGGLPAALTSVGFVVALFACVIAHEYGHALMARRYGIRTPDITLLPIGGMARMEKMPERPAQEIAVALAGPAVNVVIWAILTAFGATTEAQGLLAPGTGSFLGQLAAVNLFLALFNLIPAFPMDGGRVLRALLSIKMARPKATRLAAGLGQIAALLFVFWGISSGNLILILIAVFIFLAAQAEASDVEGRDIAKGLHLRDAIITQYEPLRPDDTIHTAGQALIRTTQHEFPVLEGGTLQGFLTRTALFHAMAEGNTSHPVSEAMTQDIPALPVSAPLEQAMDALASAPAVAAMGRDGQFLGYITRENIGELMVLRARR